MHGDHDDFNIHSAILRREFARNTASTPCVECEQPVTEDNDSGDDIGGQPLCQRCADANDAAHEAQDAA